MQKHSHVPDKERHHTFNGIDVSEVKPINNMVLCKKLTKNVGGKVGSIYYPEQSHENQRLTQNVDRVYEVVKTPSEIVYERSYWMTDVEVKKGDTVWVKPVDALNAPVMFDDEGNEYRLLKYFSLIVAKRKNAVIPLNGNILTSDVFVKKMDSKNLQLVWKAHIEVALAYVEFVGKPNKYYCYRTKREKDPNLDEGINVKPGQIVVLDVNQKNSNIISRNYLEEDMFAVFHSEKRYFYQQRCDLHASVLDKLD